MDISLTKHVSRTLVGPGQHAVVALANWYQFRAGEIARRNCVESRMLLWGCSGHGSVEVNGETLRLPAGDWLFLPWGHRIQYQADAIDPFFVGGIHVIPDHDEAFPVDFSVAHDSRDPLARQAHRRDGLLPGLDGLVQGRFSGAHDRLGHLCRYIVECYATAPRDEAQMRTLARLLLVELAAAAAQAQPVQRPIPASLRKMQEYAKAHLSEPLNIGTLAHAGACSPATVHRLFHQYEGQAPGNWLEHLRIEAAERLLRTTNLRIQEVAAHTGFKDPFHFSRFFKRATGISPSAYRQARDPL